MRGKAGKLQPFDPSLRITPAYAGKSSLNQSVPPELQGSPPPMRGKGNFVLACDLNYRITPAYAGKSRNAGVVVAFVGDHPRLCGEKTKKITKQRYFFHQPASFSFSLQYT